MPKRLFSTAACAWLLGLALLAFSGPGCDGGAQSPSTPKSGAKENSAASRIREPAVAGRFYPASEKELSRTVDEFLERAPTHYIPHLRAVICPHAGYPYSGQTAAVAYKALMGREIETVIILAPSHYALVAGASIPNGEGYRTPLGTVPISEKARVLCAEPPFLLERACPVERPPWWRQAPKHAPESGQDTPETWEHSAEVQVPFLQRAIRNFKLLPVIVGEADPERIAKVLAPHLDDKTMIVASSDLSHYHPYTAAQALDRRCVESICNVDPEETKKQEACGKTPILALLHLAKLKGWKTQLLDYRNSGDVTSEKDRVVGYSSIAFYEPGRENFGPEDRKFMLMLARRTLASVVTNGALPQTEKVSPKLAEPKACFVTLTKDGLLRGCIGHILPQEALYEAIMHNTRSAALRDPRFPPVTATELDAIKIEISVLTEPQRLPFASPEDLLGKLRPYEDGVLLQVGGRVATFLPQVWAQVPDKKEFLDHLSQKAGCPASAWRGKDTIVSTYHVESFEEPAPVFRN